MRPGLPAGNTHHEDAMGTYKTRSMNTAVAGIALLACSLGLTGEAAAKTRYDGAWNLQFVTQRGACDATYNFSVDITNGIVTHPNLVKFHGRVAPSGAVTASVSVVDKVASGSGKLSNLSGRGHWSGRAGQSTCAGYWTAQKAG
jgi:hypothetical protein